MTGAPSMFSVAGESLPDALQKKLPNYGKIPCTLMGRLAVDLDYRERGVGTHLLVDALRRALVHSAEVASWAVIVDARDAAASRLYARYGFIALPKTPGRLFMPMGTIGALFR